MENPVGTVGEIGIWSSDESGKAWLGDRMPVSKAGTTQAAPVFIAETPLNTGFSEAGTGWLHGAGFPGAHRTRLYLIAPTFGVHKHQEGLHERCWHGLDNEGFPSPLLQETPESH